MSLPRVLKARAKHSATMIFLHGLGDTGHGWAEAFNEIRPDYLKIVCPNAPSMPVSLNRGMVMPAWYDLWQVSKDTASDPLRPIKENMQDVEKSTKVLQDLIESEANKLSNGCRSRIMIGGFSQGGAIALNTILTTKEKLAGCVALSTVIPGDVIPKLERKLEIPVFHCHGEADDIIPIAIGQKTSNALINLIQQYEFHSFPYMKHDANDSAMDLVEKFIAKHLPPL